MHIGLVGLGKMGGNMRDRMKAAGVGVTGFDQNPKLTDVKSLKELVETIRKENDGKAVVWVMVPAGDITDSVVKELSESMKKGDILIDGGNSRFTEDIRHNEELNKDGIHFVDCGVSGGIWGKTEGYGLMAGGTNADIKTLMPVFDALRPEGPREEGFVHVGDVGAGHYAKMVHNGIEYGLMQAYAEGYELLAKKDIIKDVHGTFRAWQRGTVVRSWLLDLLVKALEEDPDLAKITGYVDDSGEGRWTVEEAINEAVPMPVISAALFARFASRQDDSPAMKAVAALRNQFGGHEVLAAGAKKPTGAAATEITHN
ncbi:MAG: decarboxylating 6-phosphogluconate dehydrogenase [Micrococcaceae bacterium]